MRRIPSLALVVPFHNEVRHLPKLLQSLAQRPHPHLPIVFVDNASTDGSADVITDPPPGSAPWYRRQASRIGKFHAMAAGTSFSLDELGCSHVAFLDADCVSPEGAWLSAATDDVQRRGTGLGYLHSPFVFHDIDTCARFASAYRTYVEVEGLLADRVSWFGHAGAAVYEGQTLAEYLGRAPATAEIGLRLSLFALARGHAGVRNPTPVYTSARRLLASQRNFRAWVGYRRAFYAEKDLNAADKIDLAVHDPTLDLAPDEVEWFFERQAIKFAGRNLLPLAIFDRSDRVRARLEQFFSLDLSAAMRRLRPHADADCLLGDGFGALLDATQAHPNTAALADRIRTLFVRQARAAGVPSLPARTVPMETA